jgi:hypothetical protein
MSVGFWWDWPASWPLSSSLAGQSGGTAKTALQVFISYGPVPNLKLLCYYGESATPRCACCWHGTHAAPAAWHSTRARPLLAQHPRCAPAAPAAGTAPALRPAPLQPRHTWGPRSSRARWRAALAASSMCNSAQIAAAPVSLFAVKSAAIGAHVTVLPGFVIPNNPHDLVLLNLEVCSWHWLPHAQSPPHAWLSLHVQWWVARQGGSWDTVPAHWGAWERPSLWQGSQRSLQDNATLGLLSPCCPARLARTVLPPGAAQACAVQGLGASRRIEEIRCATPLLITLSAAWLAAARGPAQRGAAGGAGHAWPLTRAQPSGWTPLQAGRWQPLGVLPSGMQPLEAWRCFTK